MYRSSSRSGRKEKKPRLPPATEEEERLGLPAAARRDGSVQHRRRTNISKNAYVSARDGAVSFEENFFAPEFKQISPKRPSGTKIKGLADEYISKEMETKRSSPSLIARLMGLDTLPPPKVVDKKLSINDCFKAVTSAGMRNNVLAEVQSFQNGINENQEFKDVFEVMETSSVTNYRNQSTRKGKLNFRPSDARMDLIRQKFMDAKRLSTDEALQSSKEFDDALEILDSNKDLFLEFLQDPNSLFAKHLQDVSHQPPSHPCQITILKSSKSAKHGSREVWSRSGNPEKSSDVQKDVTRSSFGKPGTSLMNHSIKDHCGSYPKSSSVKHVGRSESCTHPTRIVILRPNLEKAQKVSGAVSFENDNFHFGSRKRTSFVASGIQESHKEGRERQKLSKSMEYLGHKPKDSREIAKEITRQMKQTIIRRSRKAISELNDNGDETSYNLSNDAKLNEYESYGQLPDLTDEWNCSFLPSSCSSESSVSREARKRLSERWKVTRRFQEMGLVARGSSTLGEMLAQSDREMPKTIVDLLGSKKVSDEKFARDEELENQGCPLGISSKDGWKDGNSRNLSRSKSLPTTSTVSDSEKSSNRRRAGGSNNCYLLKDVLNMGSDDFTDITFSTQGRSLFESSYYYSDKHQPEREIHVNSEELRKSIHVKCLSDEKSLDPLVSHEIPANEEEPSIIATQVEQVQQFVVQVPSQDEELSGSSCKDFVTEETSGCHPQVDPAPCQLAAAISGVCLSSKEVDQPSPVSVLEPASEEESSTSGCFERISADLQELRMQLKLLKLESGGSYAEESDTDMSIDEYCAGENQSFVSTEEILLIFRNDDDRDFSYILDMIIHFGIHGANKDRLFDCCNSLGYPVGQDIFNNLEKKYCTTVSWSRSERKLLFDTTSCILSSLATPSMDLHPFVKSKRSVLAWDREDLVEDLWQMVVKQRKEIDNQEAILDPRWFSQEDRIECIDKEIERVLCDDLLEELVTELII